MLIFHGIRRDRGTDWFEERDAAASASALIIVSYGKCLYWIDHQKVLLEKGDLLFIPEHTAYYGKSIPTVFHEKYAFSFAAAPGAEKLSLLRQRPWLKCRTGLYDLLLERCKTIWTEWADGAPYADVRGQAILTEMLALWNREWDQGPVGAELQLQAERMKSYIQANYRNRLTKEELGACIGKSPNYAARLFRRVTGQTIGEYVHAVRMKAAVYMLQESMLTVGEISELLGYRDASYFHRIFKRTTGATPAEFMKERPTGK